MLKLYTASKTQHAYMWKAYRGIFPGLEIVSTWIDEAGPGESKSLSDLWLRCIGESHWCDVLLIYAEAGEHLKGALVEVGAALAGGKLIYLVGNITEKEIGSWVNHPLVFRFATLAEAFMKLRQLEVPDAARRSEDARRR